jgi:outer membrane protein OmpA-like peptidoglycan-associated protein
MTRQRILGAALAAITLFSFIGTANAQLKPWDASNQVKIDLSVLGDNGVGPMPNGPVALPSLTGDLLDPPSRMPRSRILARSPAGAGAGAFQDLAPVTLKRPGKSSNKRTAARRSTKKPRSRAPKVAALNAPPPKPSMAASKPATQLAPAPKARPKPPVKTAKAPPPPPKVAKPAPAAPPKKPEVKAPAKPAAPAQLASRPVATTPPADNHLIFKQGDANLTGEAQKSLDGLTAKLNATPKSRMQLLAYAGEPNLSASKARRLSLSRALSVRSYLIKKGVRSTRIDVRALGNKVPSGAPNRVDLKLVGN